MADYSEVFAGQGPDVARAAEFTRIRRAGQTDKAGMPYIDHIERVAMKLDDDAAKTVALLHDVLEDDRATEDELRGMFADEIVDAVLAISKRKGEPLDDYYCRVRSNPLALRVKLADIHDNLEPWRLSRQNDEKRRYYMNKYGSALVHLAEQD